MNSIEHATQDYFLPGDWRAQLWSWLKNNCPDQYRLRYLKSQTARIRMTEDLSYGLIDRKYSGLKAAELKDEVKRCGKKGECQEHKETKQRRFVGYFCNLRQIHLDCAIRYRNIQAYEMKSQYMEIIKTQNLWGFYTQVYTLTDKIRRWLDENPEIEKGFLLDARRAVAKTINKLMGGKRKLRGVQPGFSLLYHPASSENPFIQSGHFHAIILPALLDKKNRIVKTFDTKFDHALVKRIFKEELDRVLIKYGLHRFIENQYVVHLQYVRAEEKSKVDHAFKYHNRSQVLDLIKSIKKVSDDFQSFVCVLPSKKEGILVPHIKNRNQILDALEKILNPPIQIRMSYGFMRVLSQYADLLGLKFEDPDPDKDWIYLYTIEIRRIFKNIYNLEKRKITPVLIIYIRGPDDEDWEQINPSELKGEWGSKSKGKFYKAIAR